MILSPQFVQDISPNAPYHFDASLHKPSHFPAPLDHHESGKYWQGLKFKNRLLGIKLENAGSIDSPRIRLTVYAGKPLSSALAKELVQELTWRFEWERDLSAFYDDPRLQSDEILGPVLSRYRGTRIGTGFSLYELLVIFVVLQNATVRRTVQMMEALLKRYGARIRMEGLRLFAFWPPQKLAQSSEAELAALKVGYRAKMLKRLSETAASADWDEEAWRRLGNESLRTELLKLYGIGPASVQGLLLEVFHRYDVLDHVPPWEQKIYSRLLFGKRLVSPAKIQREVGRRWGPWKLLATRLVFEDLLWRHGQETIAWLEPLILL